MTTTRVDERQEDFIAQLLRYINEGRPEIAVERLQTIADIGSRFEALYGLLDAADLRSNSWQLKLKLGVLNSLAHALARALARALDLVSVIQDFELIAQVIIHLIELIPIRDELSIEIQTRYQNRLASVYNECDYLKPQETSPVLDVIAQVIWDELQNYPILITLEGVNEINADVLSEQIAPFMQAIQGFQEVHAAITGAEFVKPRIIQIHNETPKIEVFGVEGILRFFYEVLNKTKRELDLSEQREQINQTKAATDLKLEDIKDRQLDRMLKIIEFQQAILPKYLEIADDFLRQNYPQLADQQRLSYVPRIADSLMQADRTELALRFGWHDVPRPPTLPEL